MSERDKYRGWISWLGVAITFGWLGIFCCLSGLNPLGILDGRFDTFYHLELNAKGDFLAGLFAPIAVLWLIIGYYLQMKQFSSQQKQINLQTFLMLEKSLSEGLKWSLRGLLESHERFQQVAQDNFEEKLFTIGAVGRFSVPWIHESNLYKMIDFLKNGFTEKLTPTERVPAKLNWSVFVDDEYLINYKADIKYVKYYCDTFRTLLEKAKVDDRVYDFHKNSPAGELYGLFKEIIDNLEAQNTTELNT